MSLMSLTVVDNPSDRPEWIGETIRPSYLDRDIGIAFSGRDNHSHVHGY